MPLPALAGVAFHHGLTGLEFGVAIPARLGGAVRMNAGAHDGQIGDIVQDVEIFRLRDGRAVSVSAEAAAFSYRRSAFPADAIVPPRRSRSGPAAADAIRASMDVPGHGADERSRWRNRTAGACSRTRPEGTRRR